MHKISPSFVSRTLRSLFLLLFLIPSPADAFMGEDLEKPRPEFTRQGPVITAKFIPRAKSSSIAINFEATCGGKLTGVQSLDFNKYASKAMDAKCFRSDLFAVHIEDLAPGSEICMSAASSFFSTSTNYWVFNDHLKTPWINSGAENISLGENLQNLVIRVKDGGPLDSDGIANGKITVIGGPWDSFWGYVLGTLVIRFFGVFIVLAVLMAGMIISGLIFQRLSKAEVATSPYAKADAGPVPAEGEMTPEMAAAVGLAISLHLSSVKPPTLNLAGPDSSAWALDGRRQMMSGRFMVYNRLKKKDRI